MSNIKRIRTDLQIDGDLQVDGTVNNLDLSILSSDFPTNYVVSGKVRNVTGSELPAFMVPDGVALQVVIEGSVTNLQAVIDESTVVATTNITKSGLTAAPSINNTALVNDADAIDQFDTKQWGEWNHRKSIIIDSAGSEITALVGQYAAFQISGVGTEYFLAYVKSSTELTNCIRGYFYNSSSSPVKPTAFSDGDTITLCRLTHVFLLNDGVTVDVTYRNPVISVTEPAAPSTGDYWYDMTNETWKKYNGSAFVAANATLIGQTVQNGSACVAARSQDFFAQHNDINTILLEKVSNTQVRAEEVRARVGVAGSLVSYGMDRPVWDITANLAPSSDMYDATEQVSRLYWLYVKKNGGLAISDISPIRRGDLRGRYHRYNMWRCVGWFYNDASGNIQGTGNWNRDEGRLSVSGGNSQGSTYTQTRRWTTVIENTLSAIEYVDSATAGANFNVLVDGEVDAWEADYATASAAFHGWIFNADTILANVTDRTLDTRTTYTASVTGNPQPATVYARIKIGDLINCNSDVGATTDGVSQVDAIMKFIPGKEV